MPVHSSLLPVAPRLRPEYAEYCFTSSGDRRRVLKSSSSRVNASAKPPLPTAAISIVRSLRGRTGVVGTSAQSTTLMFVALQLACKPGFPRALQQRVEDLTVGRRFAFERRVEHGLAVQLLHFCFLTKQRRT